MPQLDSATFLPQIFWLVVCFVVLYVLMARTALPRIQEVMQARRQRLENDLQRAEALKAEAESVLAAYEASLARARAEAHDVTVGATQEVAALSTQRNDELTARLNVMVADAEGRIADAKTKAMAEIRGVAAELVTDATKKLIGAKPTAATVKAALAKVQE